MSKRYLTFLFLVICIISFTSESKKLRELRKLLQTQATGNDELKKKLETALQERIEENLLWKLQTKLQH